MMAEAAKDAGQQTLLDLLHDVRAEAQSILGQVETCLAVTDESSPSIRMEDLQAQVRDPLHRLVRLSAALAHQVDDDMLPDALRIGSAASRLLSLIGLGKAPVADRKDGTEDDAPAIPVTVPGARLLVVDDDEANRDILSRTLGRQGYTVETAES